MTTCDCGHDAKMHVTGSSPRYAGCMVLVEPATEHRRRRYCGCSLTPAEASRRVPESEER